MSPDAIDAHLSTLGFTVVGRLPANGCDLTADHVALVFGENLNAAAVSLHRTRLAHATSAHALNTGADELPAASAPRRPTERLLHSTTHQEPNHDAA